MNSVLPGITDDRQLPQLRTSVRVQNKQKRDESIKTEGPSSSADVLRRVDGNSQDEDEDEDRENNLPSNEDEKTFRRDGKKRRRTWELWSMEDKKAFFEALNECGKDFESMQNYLVARLRKKGSQSAVIKNKDQVRHFYYRTWHKISKHVKFSSDVKKATQEVYTLINYGELRRKVGGTLDEKKGQKLQELIQKGSTSVRVKGKSIRVRTPICRALKKLNEFQDDREQPETRVPMSIQVEIVPRNMQSWNHVQSLSHNPRVRILCSMHKPISSIAEYLQNKWRSPRLKIREALVASATFPIDIPTTQMLFLRLMPASDVIVNRINIKPDSQVKSTSMSLLSHAEMLLKKGDSTVGSKKERGRKSSLSWKSPPPVTERQSGSLEEEEKDEGMGGELSQEETEGSDAEFEDDHDQRSTEKALLNGDISAKIKEEQSDYYLNNSEEEDDIKIKEEEEDSESMDTLHQLMALETVASSFTSQDDDIACLGENTRLLAQIRGGQQQRTDATHRQEDTENIFSMEHDDDDAVKSLGETLDHEESYDDLVKRLYKGWTAKTSATITVGQLYLLFGNNQKISLQYNFEDTEEMDVELIVGASDMDSECTVVDDKDLSISVGLTAIADTPKTVADECVVPVIQETSEKLLCEVNEALTGKSGSGTTVGDNLSALVVPSVSVSNGQSVESAPCQVSVGLPLPDLVDQVSSHKVKVESELRRIMTGDISQMMNRLLSMMKSLSSPPETCFCKQSTLTKASACGLRSPVGIRSGNNLGRSPSTAKSPRSMSSSTRSPRTPTSAGLPRSPGESSVVHRSERIKPASAKRLLPDIGDKSSVNVGEVQSNAEKGNRKITDADLENAAVGRLQDLTTSAGEFRVPLGPAPRTVCQAPSSNFNAQLSKLVPRYSMPSRRAVRKNMVVQRQLPLLPRTPQPHAGFVTLTVLPPQNQLESLNLSSDSRKPVPLGIKIPTVSTNAAVSPRIERNCPTSSVGGTSITPVEKPAQPLAVQHVTVPTMSTSILLPEANTKPLETSNIISNAISVNVSGHQLLTVEMPNFASPISEPLMRPVHSASALSSPLLTTPASSGAVPSTSTTTTSTSCLVENKETERQPETGGSVRTSVSEPLTENENSDSLSRFFSETLNGLPYLTSTACSVTKGCNISPDFLGVFTSSASNRNYETTTSLLSTVSSPHINSSVPSLLMPSESSLLNTPVRLLTSDSVPRAEVDAAKMNISHILSVPDMSVSETEDHIPQIHIPECTNSLPALEISIGGTVTIPEKKLLPSIPAVGQFTSNPSDTELSLSVTCVTTSFTTTEATTARGLDDSSLQGFQDTSCDKMLDFTLANSNSNSSFSSLLAAAAGPPVLDSLMENSLLQTPPRPVLRTGLDAESFASMSAVPLSPPSSPSRLLRHTDTHWLNHDANEFSLSSLLGSMESPVKGGPSNLGSGQNGDRSPPQSLISATLNDNTVDFTATFARLNQTKENHD